MSNTAHLDPVDSPGVEKYLRILPAMLSRRRAFRNHLQRLCIRFAQQPLLVQWLLVLAAVAIAHLTLLRLPYYWDEAGYYIPAALDFYRRGTLIPEFTNAHPPLPNVVLGGLWHVTGFHILATRLVACAFASAALVAVFRLTLRLLNAAAAVTVLLLTAVYSIWFAQSTLAHADIFAAAFVLPALVLYIPDARTSLSGKKFWTSLLFALAALSKETAIIWPATLALLELLRVFRTQERSSRRQHVHWFLALCMPVLPLLAWYGYHRWRTGFTFGNPEYLRYNATANFTAGHIFQAFRYRFLHLFTQRNMWLPLLLAAACLLLDRRTESDRLPLPKPVLTTLGFLIAGNWLFFSVLGGALLTRYLLPVYPLLLLVAVAVWRSRTARWPWLALLTAAAFIVSWWWSAPTSYAPEDCLSYRDMVVTQQQAIAFINQNFPDAVVLTAWPASAELFKPELGYTEHKTKVLQIENFSREEVTRASLMPRNYDTALVITTHFVEPRLRRWLLAHPSSKRGMEYARERDRTPQEVAEKLGGEAVFTSELNGEYAAVLRFPSREQPVYASLSPNVR